MGGGSNRSRRERGSRSCEELKNGSPEAVDFVAGRPSISPAARGSRSSAHGAGLCRRRGLASTGYHVARVPHGGERHWSPVHRRQQQRLEEGVGAAVCSWVRRPMIPSISESSLLAPLIIPVNNAVSGLIFLGSVRRFGSRCCLYGWPDGRKITVNPSDLPHMVGPALFSTL